MTHDETLKTIKSVIKTIFPDCRIILFGSRSRKDHDEQSDYDILVIVKQNLSIKEKIEYESKIRRLLAKAYIDIDIIVKSESDVPVHIDRIDSIVREALETGEAI